jgi:hypothetical protein
VSDRIKVVLKKPISLGDANAPVTELHFREPTMGDFRGIDFSQEAGLDAILLLAERTAGQPKAVIDGLSPKDFPAVAEVVGGFIEDGFGTGAKPSDT